MNITPKIVSEYYDYNTKKFLKWGHGKEILAIHRAVWQKNTTSREQALQFHHNSIWQEILNLKQQEVFALDLGCGVGGMLFSLHEESIAHNIQIHATGITNSKQQQSIAQKWIDKYSIKNISVLHGDFHDLPQLPKMDVIFLVESFVHSNNCNALIEQIVQNLKETGILIIIDDFLKKENHSPKENRMILNFQENWFAPNLLTIEQLKKKIEKYSLEVTKIEILNKYLELKRPRDYFIKWVSPFLYLLKNKMYCRSLLGGNALRHCLLKTIIEYSWVKICRKK